LDQLTLAWEKRGNILHVQEVNALAYGGSIQGKAIIPWHGPGEGLLVATFANVELGHATANLAVGPAPVTGRCIGTIQAIITRTHGDPSSAIRANVDVRAESLRVEELPVKRLHGSLEYARGAADYRIDAEISGGRLHLEGRIPSQGDNQPDKKEGKLQIEG